MTYTAHLDTTKTTANDVQDMLQFIRTDLDPKKVTWSQDFPSFFEFEKKGDYLKFKLRWAKYILDTD